jgi:hypothetical protein
VAFPHQRIAERSGGKTSCVKCHHMNLPRDANSDCYECHRDMYLPSDAFRHDWHASVSGGRLGCTQCHPADLSRAASTAKACDRCHKNLVPAGATVQVKTYRAVGYVQAMHALCIGCHVQLARQSGKPEFSRCAACHKERRNVLDVRDDGTPLSEAPGKGILLPRVTPDEAAAVPVGGGNELPR